MQLHPSAVAQGVRLIVRGAVGSTNAEALSLACRGEEGPLWVVAERQTAGRGRRGRNWISEPGNLYASLLLTAQVPPERAAQLSFVAALALSDSIAEVAPALSDRLSLKWPNDVLLDGRKSAGILIEGENARKGLAIVVGMGVNCAHHPEGTRMAATHLADASAAATPERVFLALSAAMPARLAQWDAGCGFDAIRAAWLARASGIGQPILVRLDDVEIEGQFEALDEAGRLVLRRLDGRREVMAAGDVMPIAAGPGRRRVGSSHD